VAGAQELEEEDRRIRRVRLLVDLASNLIMQGGLQRGEAEALVDLVGRGVLELFPGSERTFDVVYRTRFQRLMSEFVASDHPADPILFPGRPRS
jgi:hypothetical protein